VIPVRRAYTRETRCPPSLSPVRFRWGEPEESPRAGGHRHRKLGGVVEAVGHHPCEPALYFVQYSSSCSRSARKGSAESEAIAQPRLSRILRLNSCVFGASRASVPTRIAR
jgi:hypothetical protein